MEHFKLFPTHVYIIDNVLNDKAILNIRKHIVSDYELGQENWQSTPNLHKNSIYNDLNVKILADSKLILDELGYDFDEIIITDMWSNVLKPGESHKVHTHSNNYLSGVFYVDADKASGIIFNDPRPQATVIQPFIKSKSVDNANSLKFEAKTNRLILFPSWLQHYVPVNKTSNNRISLAFNLMLKGKVGNSKEYQSAVF